MSPNYQGGKQPPRSTFLSITQPARSTVTMKASTKKWLRDAAERVGWTVAQVTIAAIAVETADIDPAYGIPIAAALAALKAIVAKHVGDKASASLGGDSA